MLVAGVHDLHAGQLRHRHRPVHVGVTHQGEERVYALGREGAGQHVGHLQLAHLGVSLFPNRLRTHDRKARHMRLPARSSVAGCDGGMDGAGGVPIVAAGWRSATSLARLVENSPSRARATCTPPALAKVSSGPVTLKLPSIASSVVSLPATLTTPEARARDAPRPSMPRPSMVQVRAVWSKARLASPRNTATVGPNFTRTDPRHIPSPWSGDSVAPGMHEATRAGSLSSGHTSS